MNNTKIKTLVKGSHKLGKNDFVLGRIMGAMAALCLLDPANEIEYGFGVCPNGDKILVIETITPAYDKFSDVIEKWYPGLCEFYYEG